MPLFFALPVIAALVGTLAFKTISDEVQEVTQETVPQTTNNLAVLALVAFGLWAGWKLIEKGKI